jgi:hypothetical protein
MRRSISSRKRRSIMPDRFTQRKKKARKQRVASQRQGRVTDKVAKRSTRRQEGLKPTYNPFARLGRAAQATQVNDMSAKPQAHGSDEDVAKKLGLTKETGNEQ